MNSRKRNTTSPELRKKVILNLLKEKDSITNQDILNACNASEITIRRDLTELEEKGFLIRTHGGAVKKTAADYLFAYNHKRNQNRKNKEYICKLASRYVNDNDIIFIDCGSTLSFLPKYITKLKSLTVITNSLPIISELISFENIKLIIIGGEVISERKAIYGPSAERGIVQYHANKAFIGTNAVSLAKGLTSYDEKEAAITLKMAENSEKVFLLCDSTKIEKNSFVTFAPLSVLDQIITDVNIDPKLMLKYERHNVVIKNK
jgi:DeoR family fructose operon transcriptional repressor